jgi:hypothetical protein
MLKKCMKLSLSLMLLCLLASVAQAQNNRKLSATLIGFEEVPALSSTGQGTFSMTIDPDEMGFSYRLTYSGLTGTVLQSHIHLGQKGVNGGIMIFFCTNLGNGPVGTQNCPQSGTITGQVSAADVIGGAAAQGIAPGEFAEVLRAIRAGVAYVNVHSNIFPGGEIRGQVNFPPAKNP